MSGVTCPSPPALSPLARGEGERSGIFYHEGQDTKRIHPQIFAIARFLCALGDLCGESLLRVSASLRENVLLLRGERNGAQVSGACGGVIEDGLA